jgi:hypothetical protein
MGLDREPFCPGGAADLFDAVSSCCEAQCEQACATTAQGGAGGGGGAATGCDFVAPPDGCLGCVESSCPAEIVACAGDGG